MNISLHTDTNTAVTMLDLATSPGPDTIAPYHQNQATATPGSDGIDIDEYMSSSVKFSAEVWNSRIQDKGVSKNLLTKKSYKQSQIPPIGPEGEGLYYYGLSCIAIDLIKIFYPQKEIGLGWTNLPKNKTNVKLKIIGRIMALRKMNDGGKYVLDQQHFIGQLENVWGANAIDTAPHHNDRVRVFGIIMTLPEFREIYQKLAEGVKERYAIDDPSLNFPEMFQNIAFAFNNEKILVTLPDGAFDLPLIEEIDGNDFSRIRIIRDCKDMLLICILLFYVCKIYHYI